MAALTWVLRLSHIDHRRPAELLARRVQQPGVVRASVKPLRRSLPRARLRCTPA
jgi:hypothetical protein